MNNIIFGPVLSRRFGKSLGIDLSPSKKLLEQVKKAVEIAIEEDEIKAMEFIDG